MFAFVAVMDLLLGWPFAPREMTSLVSGVMSSGPERRVIERDNEGERDLGRFRGEPRRSVAVHDSLHQQPPVSVALSTSSW